jgi:hypothetical protein
MLKTYLKTKRESEKLIFVFSLIYASGVCDILPVPVAVEEAFLDLLFASFSIWL